MILKTLGKIKWDDIEVGEVFAWNGCWTIFYKVGEKIIRNLADDYDDKHCDGRLEVPFFIALNKHDYYKLPESIQKLWKEE